MCNVNAVTKEVPPWCNVFYLDINVINDKKSYLAINVMKQFLPWSQLTAELKQYLDINFYLNVNLLPWWDNFSLDVNLLSWWNNFSLDINLLRWWKSFYLEIKLQHDEAISTLISIYYRETISTLMSIYYRDETISTLNVNLLPWWSNFYLDVNLLPWWNNFYLDVNLPPWWSNFHLDVNLLLWWNNFYFDINLLPWSSNFNLDVISTTMMKQISTLMSIYCRDETISTLM